jgi:hypothetical protein
MALILDTNALSAILVGRSPRPPGFMVFRFSLATLTLTLLPGSSELRGRKLGSGRTARGIG